MSRLIAGAKHLLPGWAKRLARGVLVPREVWKIEHELGTYILGKARDFSRDRGGQPEALRARSVMNCIRRQRCLEEMSECHQYLQTAFMRDYEHDLYEYYRQQQYLLLVVFLSYAFRGRGCLAPYTQPYLEASARLPKIRLLDYGAGLPFGLIHLLRTCPEKVEAITIVDLDLIHTEFVEYILSDYRASTDVAFVKLKDAQAVPRLDDRSFNFIYGKDIFEHLNDPERHLRAMLARAESPCLCYFDLSDHGAKYLQHVHPRLSRLREIPSEYSFVMDGGLRHLTRFVRNA